jgi:hypothetical protein
MIDDNCINKKLMGQLSNSSLMGQAFIASAKSMTGLLVLFHATPFAFPNHHSVMGMPLLYP